MSLIILTNSCSILSSYRNMKDNSKTVAFLPQNPELSQFIPISESEIESEFSHHDPTLARINNGSFGCCPKSVLSAQKAWQHKCLREPDDFYFNELQKGILQSRLIIKDLVNAEEVDEISIVDNATTATTIVLQSISWTFIQGMFNKDDAVIMFHYGYGAVKKSIAAYVTRAGGSVIEVHFPFPVKSNDEIVSEFRNGLERARSNGKKVRLAMLDHVIFLPTVVIPVKELVKICREEGVDQVFVDAAHGLGCVDVDMREIGADFYTSTLYKWFFGPPSAAFLYCKKSNRCVDFHHPIVSHYYGNGLGKETSWIGTRDYSPQLVVPNILEFVNRFEGGILGIQKRNHDSVVKMGEMLAKAWGTHTGCPPEMCSSMIMVGLPACLGISSDCDATNLREHLRDKFSIVVLIYYRPPREGEVDLTLGYTRISHQIYNKPKDYYMFRDAINQLVQDGFSCALLT